MKPITELLKTKIYTGNTGNTGNSGDADLMRETFRYRENRKEPESPKMENAPLESGRESTERNPKQGPLFSAEGITPTMQAKTSPCPPDEEILTRLGAVCGRAVQVAGRMRDFSPGQTKIKEYLDRLSDLEQAGNFQGLVVVMNDLEAVLLYASGGVR